MTTQQAFVSEAFHADDSIRQVYADLIGRACRKARTLGGVFAEPGQWSMQGPLEDDDECYHVRLQFSLVVPDPPAQEAAWLRSWMEHHAAVEAGVGSNVVRGTE